ncbi:transmembrane amino acid transporter protein, putative, partial [Ichthyophthirius multifiliis]
MGGITIDRNADPSTYQNNTSRTTVFSLVNSMVGATLLYYVFSIEMLYDMTTFIIYQSGGKEGDQYASKESKDYSRFSIQYMIIITFPIFLALLFLKNLGFLIKIAELGVYAIYSYVIFIFYIFIQNIYRGTLQNHIKDTKLFSLDIGSLGGTASLAFQIQTNFCPVIKCNQNQQNNRRD